jgi:DNA-binding NtrC family response regulator
MSESRRVLIVDDEPAVRRLLTELLQAEGYVCATACHAAEALQLLGSLDPDVVLTDLRLPGAHGLSLIEQGRALSPNTVFVVMTGFGTIKSAVQAIKHGAEDYLMKPLDLPEVSALVKVACEKAALSREARDLRSRLERRFALGSVLGEHPSMRRITKTIFQIADSRCSVLIHGESGSGKALLAATIHQSSPCKEGPFVLASCAGLAEDALELELFGGSPGPGLPVREGALQKAHGGTLFLDDVQLLPQPLQLKLLRFLCDHEVPLVRGRASVTAEVRLVSATRRDLKELVHSDNFSDVLYYRLSVITLDVPPLRVRRSDILLLAQHFLRQFSERSGKGGLTLSTAAIAALTSHPWPGNVRELENVIERAVALTEAGRCVEANALPFHPSAQQRPGLELLVPGLTLAELERMAILQTLEAVDGSTARAAELLDVSQRKIQYRLKEWGLTDLGKGPDE